VAAGFGAPVAAVSSGGGWPPPQATTVSAAVTSVTILKFAAIRTSDTLHPSKNVSIENMPGWSVLFTVFFRTSRFNPP
jgi:hypothetical protein